MTHLSQFCFLEWWQKHERSQQCTQNALSLCPVIWQIKICISLHINFAPLVWCENFLLKKQQTNKCRSQTFNEFAVMITCPKWIFSMFLWIARVIDRLNFPWALLIFSLLIYKTYPFTKCFIPNQLMPREKPPLSFSLPHFILLFFVFCFFNLWEWWVTSVGEMSTTMKIITTTMEIDWVSHYTGFHCRSFCQISSFQT